MSDCILGLQEVNDVVTHNTSVLAVVTMFAAKVAIHLPNEGNHNDDESHDY